MNSILRECSFLLRQRHVKIATVIIFLLASYAVGTGTAEINTQINTIEQLKIKDQQDRSEVLAKQSDYGSAAYYSFHFTYLPPSNSAFVSFGQRDVLPWKHRIRMLAIEGQIYETDADNPELALPGRFDYAFFISILLPLMLILLLHDLKSNEKEAGRFDLLTVSTHHASTFWRSRSIAVLILSSAATLIPFWIGAIIMSTSATHIALISLTTLANCIFWVVLSTRVIGMRIFTDQSSTTITAALLGIWLLLSMVIPATANTLIDNVVSSPEGGDILLTQREAVNDAWDLPLASTWEPFLARHPEWKDKTTMESQFEWKWYYAFQQVGDQRTESISMAYRQARLKKQTLANTAAFASPTMLTQRILSRIAGTDMRAMLNYEQQVRAYHHSLRTFYYPYLFNDTEYSQEAFEALPTYTPKSIQ